MMQFVKIDLLKKQDIDIYNSIEDLIKSENFPCLFAINSFHKQQMYVYDASSIKMNFYESIYKQLNIFHETFFKEEDDSKKFYTLLIVIPTLVDTSPENIQDELFKLLIGLRNQSPINIKLQKSDILKKDFEYTLDGNTWFPVLLSHKHLSKVRNIKSPLSLIAFQPKKTFDRLKKCPHNFYEKTRFATHLRINKIYKYKRPYFLSEKSSGINAIQYLGFDPEHPDEY